MLVRSLLDTDLYKFTMMQVVLHHFPGAQVEYRFNCRNRNIDLRPYVDDIREEIAWLCTLRFRERELDYLRVAELYKRFKDRAIVAFGVGTNLTNDLGYTPLNIVIKLVRCNGQPVAKLSDSPEKNMCDDPAYLAYLRQVFEIKA